MHACTTRARIALERYTSKMASRAMIEMGMKKKQRQNKGMVDEIAATIVLAVHLYVDWFLGLHLVGILMALVLLFVYYFGRSPDRPWVEPRALWLWAT